MRILTVCSGIGVPDLAAQQLDFKHVAVSEIDPHASAILAHRFPEVPNLGDMTQIEGGQYRGAVDLICGGTPCQGFSVAGSRGGLGDPRSALALKFVELLGAIRPRWFVWENVPGVFSANSGSDFAEFLGALSGWKVPVPSRGWRNSGFLPGIPNAYGLAWRTLDAQYFGVPQRRRRVFVVGCLGDWRPSAQILFERQSLSRDLTPRQKTWPQVATTLKGGSGERGFAFDNETGLTPIAFTAKDHGADASWDVSPTLRSGEHKTGHVNGGVMPAIATLQINRAIVRRLTPRECERLQGVPDDHTLVPWRSGMLPDGPRYRVLGNAIALPVIRWIFDRIHNTQVHT